MDGFITAKKSTGKGAGNQPDDCPVRACADGAGCKAAGGGAIPGIEGGAACGVRLRDSAKAH